jgi:hypothetical protein
MLRAVQLRQECARVLGSLVEKALTTPQQYPLTLNALVAACNQTTNREPVVDYDEQTVQAALDELKEMRLVRYVLPSHGRSVVRFRHVLDEALGLDARQAAVLAVLMLRGAQTAGELRIRTERMAQFGGVDEVEHELALLASRDEPLARNIGRGPGQKEERWGSPAVDAAVHDAVASGVGPEQPSADPEHPGASGDAASLGDLQAELRALGSEVAELRRELDALRASLGG